MQAFVIPIVFSFVLAACGSSGSDSKSGDKNNSSEDLTTSGGVVHANTPSFRSVAPRSDGDHASMRFKLVGYNSDKKQLGNGEIREQLGLMLRQTDQCNLVYIMWRLDEHRICVQEKSNPGKSTHEDCLNNGYYTLAPIRSKRLVSLSLSVTHTLAASINGGKLSVSLDDQEVWIGDAPQRILDGSNVGFRSDNVLVDYVLE